MLHQSSPEGASKTFSQVGKVSLRLVKALWEVVSVVFCDKMVLTYDIAHPMRNTTISCNPSIAGAPLMHCSDYF